MFAWDHKTKARVQDWFMMNNLVLYNLAFLCLTAIRL